MSWIFRIKKHIYSVAACAASVLFYFHMEGLAGDQPSFLLLPIKGIVSGFVSMRFILIPSEGYLGITRGGFPFIIDKSCSGGVFLVLCFSLLCITQLPKFSGHLQKGLALVGLLLASYLAAITASSLRIALSIFMFDIPLKLDVVLVHNLIGILTFATIICLVFIGVHQLVTRHTERRAL